MVRAWLHLHHDDPDLGRVRARYASALSGRLSVHAFRLHQSLDRQEVKNAVVALLHGEGQAADNDAVAQAAADVIGRISPHLEPSL